MLYSVIDTLQIHFAFPFVIDNQLITVRKLFETGGVSCTRILRPLSANSLLWSDFVGRVRALQIVLTYLLCALQDPKLRELITIGSSDCPLEDKMLTVAYGTDMVNISYANFATTSREIASVSQPDDLCIDACDVTRTSLDSAAKR